MHARAHRMLALAGIAALAACNDPPTVPEPATLEVVQAPGRVGAPGFPLIDTIRVRLVDEAGKAVAGGRVTWAVRDGGGSVFPLADSSDAEGVVAAIWTLGSRPGPNELRVSEVGGAAVTFKATGDVFRATKVVSDGWSLGCGLVQGSIWCWGLSSPIQGAPTSIYPTGGLSDSDRFYFGFRDATPALISDARPYTDLAVTSPYVCALDVGGQLWCSRVQANPSFAAVAGLPPLLAGSLVGRDYGLCGLAASDHRPWCMLGRYATLPPVEVPGSPPFARLALGSEGDYNCGLLADSTAMCWGDGGPLGNGSSAPSTTPVPVSGGHRFVELVAGTHFACGRTAAGEAWCWGAGHGPALLAPEQRATGVMLLGANWGDFIQLTQSGGAMRLVYGPDFAPSPWPYITRLPDLPVARYAGGDSPGCVVGPGDEVYCILNMWDTSSAIFLDVYVPVQPVRPE